MTIIEPSTALDDDFYIEQISHELTGEHDHAVTFGLEAAPVIPANVARTDTAGVGADDGVAGGGLDDPLTVAIVDSTVSGHRTDEGTAST